MGTVTHTNTSRSGDAGGSKVCRILFPNQNKSRIDRRREASEVRRSGTRLGVQLLEDRTVPSTLTVRSLYDGSGIMPGDGSLRGEIAAAQSGDTIQFASNLAGGTIYLTAGELLINKNLTIEGLTSSTGAPDLTINASQSKPRLRYPR